MGQKSNRFKLVLFDIDGTLLYHVGKRPWKDQYSYGAEKVFGVSIVFDQSKLNGRIERETAWMMISHAGVSKKVFDSNFDAYVHSMHEYLENESQKDTLYEVITSAKLFIEKLMKERSDVHIGVITGNARKTGEWKLRYANLMKYFPFGLYGDEAEDRIELAGQVFARAKKELGLSLKPQDIVIVGDTIYDIRCGKAIGAVTIAVTTGMHVAPEALAAENPDYLVDSLMDPKILRFFGI